MKIKRPLSLFLAALLLLGFSGCFGRNDENEPEPAPEITENDELVIYHNSTGLAPMLMSITEEYSKETGKKITSKLGGTDFFGEINSRNAAIFVVDTHSDLSDFHSGGILSDFLGEGFSAIFGKVPSGLHFSQNGIGSYGIPLFLEGYGYIFDREMISALFGEDNAEGVIDALRACSFSEFEGFVTAVDSYISAPSAVEITLGGEKYAFLPEKTGKALNLTGVFSLNSESTRAMEHLLSSALGARFKSRYEIMTATEESVSETEDIISAYAEVLDFQTGYISGPEGSISRGDEFTGGDYNYSTSVDLFTRGNALFYPGGTSDTADFEKSSEGFSRNLDIIPMKLPLSGEDITASGMNAEKLQSSIVIGSRYYIAVNPKADEASASAAKEFIGWLYESESGKNAYSSAFGTVPFNYEYLMESPSAGNSSGSEASAPSTESEASESSGNSSAKNSVPEENPDLTGPFNPSHRISNSLMASVGEYYSAGNWIPDLSFALPADFAEKILGNGLSDYWKMESWTEDDRENLVDTIIGGWKERLRKEDSAVG